jgi:Cu/Ag efflux protein CusF
MKSAAMIALGLVLSVACVRYASGQESQSPPVSTGASAAPDDNLHFVTVLTLKGEVVTVDPANLLVAIKHESGNVSTMEVRSAAELQGIKPGDRVSVQFFEGGQIGKPQETESPAVASLREGLLAVTGTAMKHHLVGSVERVDTYSQEVTLKGSDGSLQTIEIINPEDLENVKVGDTVVITNAQALALSLTKEG